MSQQPAYLLDASIYIFRAYFSLPDNWHSSEGYSLNAVYGYAAFLLDLMGKLRERQPVMLAAAFDESLGSCFRNDVFPDYKRSRELPDEALAFQLQCCRELTEVLEIPCFAGPRFEADDYIATLAAQARAVNMPVTVITRDKDLGQLLLGEHDRLWDFAAGAQLSAQDFAEKFGVLPAQFSDYQGLVGDSVDDIPGVSGVGAKTAAALISHYGDLERLSYNLDQLQQTGIRGAGRIATKLREEWPNALLSRQLSRLAQHIPDVELPSAWRFEATAVNALHDYLAELGVGGPLLLTRCQRFAETL